MLTRGDSANALSKAAPIFSALGDPVRLAIVARLSKDGPLPTIELKQCAAASHAKASPSICRSSKTWVS